jgi:hypothetical protein
VPDVQRAVGVGQGRGDQVALSAFIHALRIAPEPIALRPRISQRAGPARNDWDRRTQRQELAMWQMQSVSSAATLVS